MSYTGFIGNQGREITSTKVDPIKRWCQLKQMMCEMANDLGYCRITACTNSPSFSKTYIINAKLHKEETNAF